MLSRADLREDMTATPTPHLQADLPDRLAPHLGLLLCGINPGRHSITRGHHYAGPGNRFWPALWRAGITPELWDPSRDVDLPARGVGLTNLAKRWSKGAAELTARELQRGGEDLIELVRSLQATRGDDASPPSRPLIVGVLGVSAYRKAFRLPSAQIGDRSPIPDTGPVPAQLWVLPNPSGLNAHFTVEQHAALLTAAARAAGLIAGPVEERAEVTAKAARSPIQKALQLDRGRRL
jgi:TDG/mug DNA glycosylase family protein